MIDRFKQATQISRVLILLCVLVASGAGIHRAAGVRHVEAHDEREFARVQEPAGLAGGFLVDGHLVGRLFATHPACGNPREVVIINEKGEVRTFTRLPDRREVRRCVIDNVAVYTGVGAFPRNHLFVTQGRFVWKVTPGGVVDPTPFATLPTSCPSKTTGIVFDNAWGIFAGDMLLTCADGGVYRVGPDGGAPSFVASIGGDAGRPDVAPVSFKPVGGYLLVPVLETNQIIAVSPSGSSVPVISVPEGAESVHAIPPIVCSLGSSRGAFFLANLPKDTILKFRSAAFRRLNAQILVTSRMGPIDLLASVRGKIERRQFHPNVGEVEDSAFCPRMQVDIIVKQRSVPNPNPGPKGNITVVILSDRASDFVPHRDVRQGSLRFGRTGREAPGSCTHSRADANKDGIPDLMCHFRASETHLRRGETGIVTGLTVEGNPAFEGGD